MLRRYWCCRIGQGCISSILRLICRRGRREDRWFGRWDVISCTWFQIRMHSRRWRLSLRGLGRWGVWLLKRRGGSWGCSLVWGLLWYLLFNRLFSFLAWNLRGRRAKGRRLRRVWRLSGEGSTFGGWGELGGDVFPLELHDTNQHLIILLENKILVNLDIQNYVKCYWRVICLLLECD